MFSNTINNKTLVKELLGKITQEEKLNGVEWDYFVSLANISKELKSDCSMNQILETWVKYRMYIENIDSLHLKPKQFQIKHLKGNANLKQLSYFGGVVFSFHFSLYRHLELYIAEALRKEMPHIPLALVIDNESYHHENKEMQKEHKRLEIDYILAEDPKSVYKMKRILNNNGVIIIYADGNTGSGDDSSNYTATLLNSQVKVRSGSFRLLSLMNKPFFPALAKEGSIEIFEKKYVDMLDIGASIEHLYNIFNSILRNNPHLWRFWYRHHKYVHRWNDKPSLTDGDSSKDIWYASLKKSNQRIGLEVSTGRVYKMGS